MLGKTGNRYQSYCATYKTHAMTTCHGGAGHTGKDRDLNSYVEDDGNIDKGSDHDSESTNSMDTTIAFGGTEADDHLNNLLPNSQADVNIIAREIKN